MNTVRALWRRYKDEGLAVRLHVALRALLCPFEEIILYFPKVGEILDVGCGHGALLSLLAEGGSERCLRGIDHDESKITIAARRARGGAHFSTQRLEELSEAAFDVVSVVDVLYTIELAEWDRFLKGCRRLLKPGGRLILKEVIDRPRWKYHVTMCEETLAIRIFGITRGAAPHLESLETYTSALRQNGFIVDEARPLKTWHPASHCIFIAHR